MELHGLLSRYLGPLRHSRPRLDADWAFHHAAGIKAYVGGDYRGAERRFSTALARAEMFDRADKRAASTLNHLGLVYKRQRKIAKAEACFRRALNIYEVTTPGSAQFARTLYHLATLRHARKDYTEAESLYQRCIVLTKRRLGANHPKLAKRLEAYARLLKHTNRGERASELHARATAIKALYGKIAA
jgi:tetratricopeptide (TPR) repeat protein